jgi:hypothetical protein
VLARMRLDRPCLLAILRDALALQAKAPEDEGSQAALIAQQAERPKSSRPHELITAVLCSRCFRQGRFERRRADHRIVFPRFLPRAVRVS